MLCDDQLIEPSPELSAIKRLRAIMQRLRAPSGCPWDIEQTHESLISNLIEESYEVIDAIRRRDFPHLEEELGDLLLQVVFHAQLGSERNDFDFDSIATAISEKLIRRHPHVFCADQQLENSKQVLQRWEEIKAEEKRAKGQRVEKQESVLGDAGEGLPALLRAAKIQKRAAKVGFDWERAADVTNKVTEELEEVRHELGHSKPNSPALREELGDLLFSVVNLVRHCGENPEECLAHANEKFVQRFQGMEQEISLNQQNLEELSLNELEELWQKQKG